MTMKFENFKTFVLKELEVHYADFYSSYEEYVKHYESGEVTISTKDMFNFYEKFEKQRPSKEVKNKITESVKKEDPKKSTSINDKQDTRNLAEWLKEAQKDFDKKHPSRMDEWSNKVLSGQSTGSGLLDALTSNKSWAPY